MPGAANGELGTQLKLPSLVDRDVSFVYLRAPYGSAAAISTTQLPPPIRLA
jgi:hypothetical protein